MILQCYIDTTAVRENCLDKDIAYRLSTNSYHVYDRYDSFLTF